MIMRQAVAARLLALLEDERAIETRPIEEIEAELRLWGIEATSSIERARSLAAASQSPAGVLLARIEDAEATESEIHEIESARLKDVRARLQRESRSTSAATPQHEVKGAANVVRRWLGTSLAVSGSGGSARREKLRPEHDAASLIEHTLGAGERGRRLTAALAQADLNNPDAYVAHQLLVQLQRHVRGNKLKRVIDVVLASLLLVVTAPLFLLTALAIRLDSPGPIFFVQERLGQHRRPFRCIKFRSMCTDAERLTGPVWASANDARITRIGRLLRPSRLDELPQLINVLRGDMSLVGTRPRLLVRSRGRQSEMGKSGDLRSRRRQRSDWLSPMVIVGLLRFADAAIVVLAAVAAWITRYYGQLRDPFDVLYVCVLAVLLTLQTFQFANLYNFERLHQLSRQFRRLVLAWGAVILTILAIGYMAHMTREFHLTSRLWIGLWFMYGLLGLLTVRTLLRHQLQRWQAAGRLTRNVVILGAGERGQRLVEHLLRHGDGTQRIVGVFDDRRTRVPKCVSDIPVQGTVDDLLVFARHNPIDQIIVALPWDAEPRLLAWTKKLQSLPADICFCPHVGSPYPPKVTHIAGVPMLTVLVKPLSGWSYIVKSAEDRVLAAALLALTLPVTLLIALLIKSDSRGPILVRQKRYGFNNEVIEVYRFRTESVDRGGKGQPATWIGRILYRTSLNELPQLINVLTGSMSIVGPRPSLVPHNEEYVRLIDGYLARLRVKPGITGWAQINGLRGDAATVENMEQRVRHDLYYIENWSLLFDLRIILRTFFVSLRDA